MDLQWTRLKLLLLKKHAILWRITDCAIALDLSTSRYAGSFLVVLFSITGRWKMTWAVPIVDHRGSSEWRGHRNENPLCRRDFPIQVLKTAQVSRTDYSSVLKNDWLEFLPFSLMIFTPLSQNPWDIVRAFHIVRAFPSLTCLMAEGYLPKFGLRTHNVHP